MWTWTTRHPDIPIVVVEDSSSCGIRAEDHGEDYFRDGNESDASAGIPLHNLRISRTGGD